MNKLFQNEICEKALKDIAGGDMSGLNILYENFARLLFSVAYTTTGSRETAEDVLQDTFLKIAENAVAYKHRENGSVKAWVVTICRNLSHDYLRKNVPTVEIDHNLHIKDTAADIDSDLAFFELLSQLENEEKEIIILKLYSGFRHTEIAKILDLPPQNVRQKYKRAVDKLKKSNKKEA